MIRKEIIDMMARSSLHVVMLGSDKMPRGYGSGCIVKYRMRNYLLSVAHVTDVANLSVCIETNEALVNNNSPLYCVGAMSYFDQYQIDPELLKRGLSIEDVLQRAQGKTLDITFCNINEELKLVQKEWDFGSFKIEEGEKIYLDLDQAVQPEKGKLYGFFGRVKQGLSGMVLRMQVTAKINLEYSGDQKEFHKFLVPELITDEEDYQGCSGAPILDEDGKLVGLAQSIFTGTKVVMAFSIKKCKELMDAAIVTKMIE